MEVCLRFLMAIRVSAQLDVLRAGSFSLLLLRVKFLLTYASARRIGLLHMLHKR